MSIVLDVNKEYIVELLFTIKLLLLYIFIVFILTFLLNILCPDTFKLLFKSSSHNCHRNNSRNNNSNNKYIFYFKCCFSYHKQKTHLYD